MYFEISIQGGECQPGFYCPEGSHEPIPCQGGHYCAGKRNFNYTGPCQAGFYCSGGSSVPDPRGIYGDTCPQGKYCIERTEIPEDCPQGRYSNATGILNIYVLKIANIFKFAGLSFFY